MGGVALEGRTSEGALLSVTTFKFKFTRRLDYDSRIGIQLNNRFQGESSV